MSYFIQRYQKLLIKHIGFILLLFIIAIAFVIRIVDLPSKGLWYDELQSVTHASLPITDLIKSVQMYDPHPPLYYIQLHYWMLLDTSDWWIKLNSVLWSVLTVVSIFIICKEIFNLELAIFASLIFAVSPFAILYAQEARMYSFLTLLGIWSFYFTYRFIFFHQGFLEAISVTVFTIAFLYSHGAGFMLLISLYSYAGLILFENKPNKWRIFLKFFFIQLVILALYVPWLYRASSITVGTTMKPTLENVIDTLFILLYGVYRSYPEWFSWLVVMVVVLGIIGVSIRVTNIRSIVISFLITPVLFCIVVSYLNRPIWLYRTLAYTVPFFSIAIASVVFQLSGVRRQRKLSQNLARYSLIGVITAFFIFGSVLQQTYFSHFWNIRDAAKFLRATTKEGDVIYIPNERVFWGFSWYFEGPGSVNPLTTDYSLTSQHGVRIVSKPSIGSLNDNWNYWLVYRDVDSVVPFVPQQPDSVRDFNRLIVAHQRK